MNTIRTSHNSKKNRANVGSLGQAVDKARDVGEDTKAVTLLLSFILPKAH
jgi:hypothetical protein